MKNPIPIITFILVAGLALGCASTKGGPAHTDKAVTQTLQDCTYAQKSEYVYWMKKELSEIQKELDRLYLKVEASLVESRTEARLEIEAVRVKWLQAKKELDLVETATESTWKDVKGGFTSAYSELNSSYDKTSQWMSNKIAP